MTLLEQMAPGVLGPGLTSAAIFLAAWFLSRRLGRPGLLRFGLLRYGTLLGVAAGFAVGFIVLLLAGALLASIPPLVLSAVAAWIAYAHAPPPNPYG